MNNRATFSLSLLLSLLLIFASCEDQSLNTNSKSVEIEVLNPNQGRVFNYSQGIQNPVFKSLRSTTFPASIPADAIDMSSDYKTWQVTNNQNYYLPAGKSYSGQLRFLENVNYYIEGTLELTSSWGNASKIYVMDNGTMIMNRLQSATVYSKGNLQLGDNFILSSATINSLSPVQAKNIKVENGAILNAEAEIQLSGRLHLTGANWNNGQTIYSQATFNSCATLNEAQIDHSCKVTVNNYLEVTTNIDMTSGQLKLGDQALVSAALLTAHNASTNVIGGNSAYAVLDVDKIKLHNNTVERIFYSLLDIHALEIEANGSGTPLAWAPEIKIAGDTYIAADGCKPAFGTAREIKKEYTLQIVASLTAPDERISATSLCFENENSFVSWHEKGAPFQGYIDMITYDAENDTIILQSTYYSASTDFNHIYKGGDIIYTACDNYNTGAMVGEVGLSNGDITLTTFPVPGSSANWIEKVDNKLLIAAGGTEGAFSKYDLNTQKVEKIADLPYAKSIFAMSNGYGILYDVLEEAKIYNTTSGNTFNVGAIAPENGKNASFSYDNKVYVAQGNGGLGVYTMNGTNVGNFVVPTTEGGDALNGVYVDEDYIYLAYGTAGIYLLNHDLEKVFSYKYDTDGASANFIRKEGNFIFVSYGLSGVHVLKISEVN